MSDITITIPLSALSSDTELSAGGIMKALNETGELVARNKEMQAEINHLARAIRKLGVTLTELWEGQLSDWDRANSLRNLANEARTFKARLETDE